MSKERELLEMVVSSIVFDGERYYQELPTTIYKEISHHLAATKPIQLEPIVLPFTSDAFKSAWLAWEKHRKENRKKLTPTTRERQLAKCGEWGEARAIAAINHSIDNGYQGLFEPSKPVIQQQSLVTARKNYGY